MQALPRINFNSVHLLSSPGENIEQLEIQEFNIVTSKDVARNESTSEMKDDDVEAESEDEVEGSPGSKTRSKASKSLEEELEVESRKNKKKKLSAERSERKVGGGFL